MKPISSNTRSDANLSIISQFFWSVSLRPQTDWVTGRPAAPARSLTHWIRNIQSSVAAMDTILESVCCSHSGVDVSCVYVHVWKCVCACVCVCLWVCFESLKSPNYEKQRCRDIEYIHTQHPGWAVIVLFHCDDDITVSASNQPSKCMWNQIWMCSCRPHFCWFHLVNDQGQMMIYYYNTKNIPNIVIFNCLYIVVTRRTFQFFHHPPLLQHLCLYNGVLVGVLTVLVIQLHPTPTISSGSTLWHFLLRD